MLKPLQSVALLLSLIAVPACIVGDDTGDDDAVVLDDGTSTDTDLTDEVTAPDLAPRSPSPGALAQQIQVPDVAPRAGQPGRAQIQEVAPRSPHGLADPVTAPELAPRSEEVCDDTADCPGTNVP